MAQKTQTLANQSFPTENMLFAQTTLGVKEGVQYVLVEPGRIEFLIVLIGVVVGLSIGKLVSFTGQLINNRDYVSIHPTFLIYLLCLFLYQIYYWWGVFELKADPERFRDLSFLSYFRLLLIPLFLYCATAVMCKDLHDVEEFSMKDHFTKHARAFYLLVAALIVTALLQAMHLWDKSWQVPEDRRELAIRTGGIIAVGLAWLIPPRITQLFHLFLSIVVLGLLSYFIYDKAILPSIQNDTDENAALVPATPLQPLPSAIIRNPV